MLPGLWGWFRRPPRSQLDHGEHERIASPNLLSRLRHGPEAQTVLRQLEVLDSQLRSKTGTEPGKVMGILPAAANDVPSRVHKIMLPTEPFAGVLAYFLLLVAKLRLAIGLDDDLQIRKDNIPEIGVVSYPDGTLSDDAPRVQAFDDPQNRGLENVVASSVRCSDDAVRALAPMVICMPR